MFVYMSLELGGGGDEYKKKVLMCLMCLMFAVQLCEPYVTADLREGAAGEEMSNHAIIMRLSIWPYELTQFPNHL